MKARLLAALLVAVAAAMFFAFVAPGPQFREFSRARVPGAAASLHGPARVVDGDTLEVDGRKIRMFGIDAPERAQTCRRNRETYACGHEATAALRELVADAVTCQGRDTDRYGRLVAVCFHGGRDINAAMVEQGWAVAYRQYSTDYVGQEAAARSARRGLWAGSFDQPQDWRRAHRP
jgi:endonuclease YncB( thermonuclease family)